jgi:hypothetical protein
VLRTHLYRNQRKKNFTFKGILIFHRNLLWGMVSTYIYHCIVHDLTENCPLVFSDHLKTSGWSFKCVYISTIRSTKLFQSFRFRSTSDLRKEMFRGVVLRISKTVSIFLLTILYRLGYCCIKVDEPNQMSSQNLICMPFCNMKIPKDRNWFLTFTSLLQNESHLAFSPLE